MTYKHLFGRFAAEAQAVDRLHFAAHSHHWWPDVSMSAQGRVWEDAAVLVDDKWSTIFDTQLPAFQGHVARILGLPDPSTVSVAPNTHEFLVRILSCLDEQRPVKLLTTTSEFHSMSRQLARWIEAGRVVATQVDNEPFDDFDQRFGEAAARPGWDLIYFSQVFFDSGFVIRDLGALVSTCHTDAVVVIDGYHGFCALPTDLAHIAPRAFYIAGGYKYAMSGEGACFMHCPPGVLPRPVDTGWFAGYGDLQQGRSGEVGYAKDASRFLGSTFDPSGLYRFNAVQDMLVREGLDVGTVHAHVSGLQARFLRGLGDGVPGLTRAHLISDPEARQRGHFLTFRSPHAGSLQHGLAAEKVVTDVRADSLRLGFALYHDEGDVDELLARIERLAD